MLLKKNAAGTTFIVIGTGNYTLCKHTIQKLFNKTSCPFHPPSCSFNGSFQPQLPEMDFVAFSGYYYTVSFLNGAFNGSLPKALADGRIQEDEQLRLPLNSVENMAKKYCGLSWSTIQTRWGNTSFASFLDRYCFNAAYIVNILNYGFGFSMDKNNLLFAGSKNSVELGWALGGMIYEENLLEWNNGGSFLGYVWFVIVISFLIALTLFGSIGYLIYFEFNRRSYLPS